jgi:hypothetical protein
VNRGPYRDGQVHVMAEKCPTCVFRPGNLMHLQPGRLTDMVRQSIADGGGITCHDTLYREDVDQATCRGFWDAHRDRVQAFQVAERLHAMRVARTLSALLVFDPVPPPRERRTEMFAELDHHDGEVRVVAVDQTTKRHDIVETIGKANSRRDATVLLKGHGYDVAGRWRTGQTGAVRSVRKGRGR